MRWIRWGFLIWAVFSMLWIANSMRTRGIDAALLRSSSVVTVADDATRLDFLPITATNKPALIFVCGSGVAAEAYAPLLHPIADAGHSVFVIKLPYRFAFFESHKEEAVARARNVIAVNPNISKWVIAGHSLGGALACRIAKGGGVSAAVLIGTTHPKQEDLSALTIPVTKIYGSNDGVAPVDRIFANKHLLPNQTQWIEVKGGNHSQFGHYGHQFMDGTATITREAQQAATRSVLLEVLSAVK